MVNRRPVVIILALLFFWNEAMAKTASLIHLQGGREYFDGNTKTAPNETYATIPFSDSEEPVRLFEEARLTFGEEVTIDRVDIRTKEGNQICYFLGYQADGWTVDRYNGVPGFDIRADKDGVQSIPINPPIRGSLFSIQCFLNQGGWDQASSPFEIYFYQQGERIQFIFPQKETATVLASTTLAPSLVYGVDNLFDGELETVWAEGAPGYGEGSTITFSFNVPIALTGVWFANGHQRDDETFKRNGRLKGFTFAGETYRLQDRRGVQIVPLKKEVQSSTLSLTVLSHYPGSKYKDLCLTEMGFKSGDTFIRPQTEGTRLIVEKNRRALQGPNSEPFSAGSTFLYDTETARFSYSDPNNRYEFKGIARVVSASPTKTIFDLEGYLDRGDFDNYGNVIVLKSRTAEKMKMTITRPSLLSFKECKEILTKQGLAEDPILESHKTHHGIPRPRPLDQEEDYSYLSYYYETWYISPLGFHRSKFDLEP